MPRSILAVLLTSALGLACSEETGPRPSDAAVEAGRELSVPRELGGGRELGAGDGPAPSGDGPALVSASLAPSTANLPNPERGFYAFTSDLAELDGGDLQDLRDVQNLRLAYVPTLLAAYRNSSLPQSYLDTLSTKLALVRGQGMKIVLRFAYNYEAGGEDAPLAMVKQHIGQLAPLLKANADVIAYLQAGFIGAWGEWHSSTNGLTSDANRAAIRDALLAAAPASMMVQFRYPPDLIKWYPSVLGASQAFTATAQARASAHNDCFLSSDDDVGTYSDNKTVGDQQRAYIKALTDFTPFGGETCDAGPASEQRRSCSAILAEGRDYHLTFLNVSYYQAFHTRWKSEGCYDEVARTMGYRFQLDRVTHPLAVARGGSALVQVELRNLGWARIWSARKLTVTLRHLTTGAELSASAGDLRTLPPQAKSSTAIQVPVAIPAGAATGEHEVLLSIPDIHATTAADIRYAVRPANEDAPAKDQAWEPGTGRFAVGTRLEVR